MKTAAIIITTVGLVFVNASAKTNIVALQPSDAQFQTVVSSIQSELDTSYHVDAIDISKPVKTEDVAARCKKNETKALIIMDRQAIKIAEALQKFDNAFVAMPKFVYMTLLVEVSAKGLSNAAGIRFEVPIYTLVTNFRIISQTEFLKVGIFHRKSYTGAIEEAEKLLSKEQISLNPVCVDCEKNGKTTQSDALSVMRKSFDAMLKEHGADIFLVPADNLVVNNSSLGEFWIGTVKKKNLPVIASLDMLANPSIALAVFTADPDLQQLGAQAANQIMGFFENGTPLGDIGFEPVISIKSTLNESIAKEIGWKLNAGKLGRINKIVK